MTQIPDAAVQAAMDVTEGNVPPIMLERALTAALPHLPLGFEIKKLEWVKHPTASLWRAETTFGVYQSWGTVNIGWLFDGYSGEKIDPVNTSTEEQAKAAAQADFERRVRECHVPVSITKSSGCVFNDLGIAKPVDVAAVRRQAFEEALKIIECEADELYGLVDDVSHHLLRKAKQIRALTAAPTPEAGR